MSNPFPNTVPQVPPPAFVGPSTFVDESDALSPTWWNGPNGARVRYSMSVLLDSLADGAEQAVKARFPSSAPLDAFQWLQADRMITPGPSEAKAHLIWRLQQWLTLARYFGTNEGIMLAVSAYISPFTPVIKTVNNNGIWYTYPSGVDPFPIGQTTPNTPIIQNIGNWDWDGNSDPFLWPRGWWRTWLIVDSIPTHNPPWPAPSVTYGTWFFGDGTAWNWAGTQNDRQALQNLAKVFKGAHTYVPMIIVNYNNSNFQPGSVGSHVPDGNWGHWHKVVATGGYPAVYVPARDIASASYIDGVL